MKKVVRKSILLFICFFAMFGSVNAATIEVGSGSVIAGQSGSVTLDIKDADLKDYTQVEFKLTVSTTNADINFNYSNGAVKYYAKDGDTIILKDEENGLSAATIGNISYTTTTSLSESFNITPVEVKFYKKDATTGELTAYTASDSGISIKSGTIKYEVPKSTDATLSSITISQGALTPDFSTDVTDYTVNLTDRVNTVILSATKSHNKATFTGTGSKTLELGKNTFEIAVTAEDGTTKKTYKVTVYRGEEIVPSAFIESLKINDKDCTLSPEFDKNNTKYTVNGTHDLEKLDFSYELEDDKATIEITGNEKFVVGENKITIKVTASDNSATQEYEIIVNIPEEEESTTDTATNGEKKEKKNNLWLIIILVLIILLLIGACVFIIIKRKRGNKRRVPTQEVDQFVLEEQKPSTNSVIDSLKNEYQSDKTETYDKDLFKKVLNQEDESLEKTKEFNFRDFK